MLVLLVVALYVVATPAMAIDEVIIKHKEDGTWSSREVGADPWEFCREDGGGAPFKAVAIGFIDANDDPGDDPDKPINWKVVITNTKTDEPTVLIDCSDPNDKGYHAGDEIEFDMPLHTSGPYTLTATATNAENAADSAGDTDKVNVVEVGFWAGSGEDAQEITDDGLTALKEHDAQIRAVITPSRAASDVTFQMRDTDIATVDPTAASGSPEDLTVDGLVLGETVLDAKLNGNVCQSMSVTVEEEEWILSFQRVKKDETSSNDNQLMGTFSATNTAEDDEENYSDVNNGDTVAVCVGDKGKFKYRAGGNWFYTILSFTCDVDWENANETEENDSEGWSKAENTWSNAGTYKVTATRTWNALWFIPVSSQSESLNVDVVDVTFDSLDSPICAASTGQAAGTSLATASVTPSDRKLKWELMDNDIDASLLDSEGNTTQQPVETEGNTVVAVAGSEGGTVNVRVCDSVLTSCTAATKELTVVDVSFDSLSPTTICAASTGQEAGTSLATASVTPSGRELEWELMDNDIGATMTDGDGNTSQSSLETDSETVLVTAGNQGGTVIAQVSDPELPSCTAATKELGVIAIKKIPLGGSADLSKYTIGKLYVPTKWGGTVQASANNLEMFYTDGSDLDCQKTKKIFKGEFDTNRVAQGNTCTYSAPENKHGWYYVKAAASSPSDVSAKFEQSGEASDRPWNFYWWAKKGNYIYEPDGGNGTADTPCHTDDDQIIFVGNAAGANSDIIRCGDDGILQTTAASDDPNVNGDDEEREMINLFDLGGPLDKYDNIYGTKARDWEAKNDPGTKNWEGHCLGGAMLSILLNQPDPTDASGLTVDELEGLWSELGETSEYRYHQTEFGCPSWNDANGNGEYDSGEEIIPQSGNDETDKYADNFHRIIEKTIGHFNEPLQSNLRSEGDDPTSVWNHAVWKYKAEYEQASGDDEKVVKITIDLYANEDEFPVSNSGKNRHVQYMYIIKYDSAGVVDDSSSEADWISVEGEATFAPYNMLYLKSVKLWNAQNGYVTESNVRALDSAN